MPLRRLRTDGVLLAPTRKEATLSIVVDGRPVPGGAARGLDLSPGVAHSCLLSVQGNAVTFTLDGVPRLRHTAMRPPASGSFQWEVPEGLHVHGDDVRVSADR